MKKIIKFQIYIINKFKNNLNKTLNMENILIINKILII